MIHAEHLVKHFKVIKRQAWYKNLITPQRELVKAVDDLSFDVAPGECIGYLGPNGSGKSTTIKCLTGILLPTSGQVRIFGLDPWRNRYKTVRRIGVLFGQKSLLFPDLPVQDALELYQRIYRIPKQLFRNRIEEFDMYLNIHNLIDKPVRKLSLGERMKCELLAALIHGPDLVFLDEPTIGLDLLVRVKVLTLLQKYNSEQQKTIFLSSHRLDDVESLCNRIILIAHGKLLFDGTLDDLKTHYGVDHFISIKYTRVCDTKALDELAPYLYGDHSGRMELEYLVPDSEGIQAVLSRLMRALEVIDISITSPPLEVIVRSFLEGYE